MFVPSRDLDSVLYFPGLKKKVAKSFFSQGTESFQPSREEKKIIFHSVPEKRRVAQNGVEDVKGGCDIQICSRWHCGSVVITKRT